MPYYISTHSKILDLWVAWLRTSNNFKVSHSSSRAPSLKVWGHKIDVLSENCLVQNQREHRCINLNPIYGVLVATRNRPESLAKLLESLLVSSIRPTQIVIASSGNQITEVINNFRGKLPITHLHIEGKGQIRQKMAGIKLLLPVLDWVAFLDDDVILDSRAIENMSRTMLNFPNYPNLVGVCFSASNWTPAPTTVLDNIFAKIFGVSTKRKGVVLQNGQNSNYIGAESVIQTSWLNGASMWRKKNVDNYNFPFLNASYSVCEDLIYSYQESKNGILIYDPNSHFAFQNNIQPSQLSIDAFSALTYWRMYFVLTNSELSINLFLWAQIGRTLNYTLSTKGSFENRLEAARDSFLILIDVFALAIKKVSPIEILEMRQNNAGKPD